VKRIASQQNASRRVVTMVWIESVRSLAHQTYSRMPRFPRCQ
jgi:hypothetical protein